MAHARGDAQLPLIVNGSHNAELNEWNMLPFFIDYALFIAVYNQIMFVMADSKKQQQRSKVYEYVRTCNASTDQ